MSPTVTASVPPGPLMLAPRTREEARNLRALGRFGAGDWVPRDIDPALDHARAEHLRRREQLGFVLAELQRLDGCIASATGATTAAFSPDEAALRRVLGALHVAGVEIDRANAMWWAALVALWSAQAMADHD